ncbi:Uncharacterised protein [Bordetella pertussis]|nr:Uncharacterised protein [Bordetella pertussis]
MRTATAPPPTTSTRRPVRSAKIGNSVMEISHAGRPANVSRS